MQAFIEEYGKVVVAILIIMIIVVAATPLGESIRNGLTDAVSKLTTSLGKAVSMPVK